VDNVTHTLFALTLARTRLGRAGRGATAALVVASNAPDIDIVAAARGATSYLAWHRGPTHGPLGVVVLGVASAGLVWIGRRWLDRRAMRRGAAPASASDASFGLLVSMSLMAVLLHVLMDLPTSYGTRLLSPFDWRWFAFDWTPIIDWCLLLILGVGLAFGELSKGSRPRLAALALTLMAADYGVRAAAHQQALDLAPRLFGPLLPQPCGPAAARPLIEVWPRSGGTAASSRKPCLVEIAALPTFASPFRWGMITHLSNGYDLHELDLLDARFHHPADPGEAFWRRSVRYPNQWTPATFAAAATRTGRVFLGFARFPAARTFVDSSGVASVRWADMRFVGSMLPFGNGSRPADRLTALVRIGPDGRVIDEEFSQ
jgi:inner membrane protein